MFNWFDRVRQNTETVNTNPIETNENNTSTAFIIGGIVSAIAIAVGITVSLMNSKSSAE